ncbi:DUF5984 family protein [Amycolatopsis rhabdoformis]|uniref:DUF5984 family protein n=1 Tax=Amycolatopsis rhabdoformis TaxID=1448059 RepID=A0ABZ1ICE5_9PSEU|nr:DUF5984 family protein [Amycolatopsis rhabdoformis]WSE32105.1 DUF5984 family protein [Amycolatopsis rhabdoformis]
MMRFRFELVPVDEVGPWGSGRSPSLHWFALTEGWFCLDVGGIELLRYAERTVALFRRAGSRAAPPWVDYYVVRLWEDMLQALPYILDPVPDDLADFVAAGSAEWIDTDDPEILDNTLIDAADDACGRRCVDTGYLRYGPVLRWWRTVDPVDTVTVDWQFAADPDGEIAFTAPLSGRASVSTDEFMSAVTDFDHRLFEAMQQRVDRLAATGAPAGIELDIPHLIQEQAERRTWLPRALAQQVSADWDAVRAGVRIKRKTMTA